MLGDPEREPMDKGFDDQPTQHEVDDGVSKEYVKDDEDVDEEMKTKEEETK